MMTPKKLEAFLIYSGILLCTLAPHATNPKK